MKKILFITLCLLQSFNVSTGVLDWKEILLMQKTSSFMSATLLSASALVTFLWFRGRITRTILFAGNCAHVYINSLIQNAKNSDFQNYENKNSISPELHEKALKTILDNLYKSFSQYPENIQYIKENLPQ